MIFVGEMNRLVGARGVSKIFLLGHIGLPTLGDFPEFFLHFYVVSHVLKRVVSHSFLTSIIMYLFFVSYIFSPYRFFISKFCFYIVYCVSFWPQKIITITVKIKSLFNLNVSVWGFVLTSSYRMKVCFTSIIELRTFFFGSVQLVLRKIFEKVFWL